MSDDTCSCQRCGSTFADTLAYAAHRQWVSRHRRGPCKFPRSLLYQAGDVWTLRPSAVDAVALAEYSPDPDAFYIVMAPRAGKRQGGESAEMTPSVYAASSGSS